MKNFYNFSKILDSKILTSDKPKNNVFILKCVGNQKSTVVERFFAASNQRERYLKEEWNK